MSTDETPKETRQPRAIGDLPLFEGFSDPSWCEEIPSFVDDVFGREYQGLLRAPGGSVVAYRNRDIRALMADSTVGNLPAANMTEPLAELLGQPAEPWRHWLASHVFGMTGPLHPPARRVLARQLTRGKSDFFRELADRVVREVAAEAIGASEMDFQEDYAGKVAVRFWSDLCGLEPEEEVIVQDEAERMGVAFRLEYGKEEARAANEAAARYMTVVSEAIMREADRGESQVLAEMANDLERIDLPGRPDTVGDLLAASLFDGVHTVKVGLTNIAYSVLSNPWLKEKVEADRDLIGDAVQEGLRLYPAVAFTDRFTTQPIVHDGVEIPPDTPITMLWSVGNRDPNVFDEPNSFKLGRKVEPQVTFGGGPHICPGRHVSVILGEAVLRMWCEDRLRIELNEPVQWLASASGAVKSLNVAMVAAD